MANLLQIPTFTALDSSGDPISGAKLYFYKSGTSSAADTYSDGAATTANTNPVVADSAGRFGPIYMQNINYKVVLTDASDATIWTRDPVAGQQVVTGDEFKVTQQSPADMTVLVSAGAIFNQVTKALTTKTAQSSGSITAPSSNPRYDIVYVDRLTGVIGIDTGSEAASPSDPTITNDKLPLARISLATTTTEITDSLITDIREINLLGAGDVVRYNTGAGATAIELGAQDWTAVASATTTDIGAAATARVNVTGTTTITGLGTATAGLAREVRFDGALTLTYNATSLILPGNANILTVAGDTAKFVSEGSGNWRCLQYTRRNGAGILQVVQTQTGAVATGTTVIPNDDTIPQNTEGDEYMTLAITPKSASSQLRIDVVLAASNSNASSSIMVALFRDSGADALAAIKAGRANTATSAAMAAFSHTMASPGTSSTTFKVRAGDVAAGTTTFNGQSGGRLLGGVMASSIIITEYMP